MSTVDARNKILSASGPVFAEKGFERATVREICRKAGVNLASVNYYFGDKQGLYIESVKRAHQLRIEQVPLPEWPEGTSPADKLEGFITTLAARILGVEQAPWQTRLMLREILHPTEACKRLVEEYFRPHFELLLSILDDALPAGVPDHTRHQIGFSIVGQILYYRVAGEVVTLLVSEQEYSAHYSIGQLADHITRMTLAAVGLSPLFTETAVPPLERRSTKADIG